MSDDSQGAGPDIDAIRAFAEGSPAAIAVLAGPDHRLLYLNPAFVLATGLDATAPLGRPVAEVLPALVSGRHGVPLDRLRASGQAWQAQGQALAIGDPELGRCWDVEASALRRRDGGIQGILLQLRDVTEAHRRLGKAEAAAAVLDAVFEHAPLGLAVATAPDAKVIRVSRHGLALAQAQGEIGREPVELLAGTAPPRPRGWGVFHHDGKTPARTEDLPLRRALRRGEPVLRQQWVLRGRDGMARRVQCSAAPVRDGAGRIAAGLLAWNDPSDRALATDARYRSLVENGALADRKSVV